MQPSFAGQATETAAHGALSTWAQLRCSAAWLHHDFVRLGHQFFDRFGLLEDVEHRLNLPPVRVIGGRRQCLSRTRSVVRGCVS